MIIHNSISLLALVGAVLVSVGIADAQNHCSLRVRVLSPQEKRVFAVVSVREQDGRELEQDHKAQDLEFCDLGILPVRVTVHLGPGCNEITVRDIFLSLEETYVLKVSYDPKNCSPEQSPPLSPSCNLLLRVRDGGGRYLTPRSTSTIRETWSQEPTVMGGIWFAGESKNRSQAP